MDEIKIRPKRDRKEYFKQYRENNKEKRSEINRKWRESNPDKIKVIKYNYREKHKDILKVKKSEYYFKNVDNIKLKKKLNPEKYLLIRAKNRAKTKGLEFNITLADIIIPPVCPILGIPLILADGKRNFNSPSIDRINNDKGYIKGNVVVISWRANLIKNCGTADELMRIALFMKSYNYDL